MSEHIEYSATETIRLLASESFRLTYGASEAMRAIELKVSAEGINALTPAETIYVSTLLAERQLLTFRERLMTEAQP